MPAGIRVHVLGLPDRFARRPRGAAVSESRREARRVATALASNRISARNGSPSWRSFVGAGPWRNGLSGSMKMTPLCEW